MTDKVKQAARHIQDITKVPYMTALNILRGNINPIPITPDCLIKKVFDTMPEKLKSRLPELGKPGKPGEIKSAPRNCICPRCSP